MPYCSMSEQSSQENGFYLQAINTAKAKCGYLQL
jgi:hypothetical protein